MWLDDLLNNTERRFVFPRHLNMTRRSSTWNIQLRQWRFSKVRSIGVCSCRFVSGETWKSNRSMLFSVELGAMTIAVPPSLGSGKKKAVKLQVPYLAALVRYTLGNIILLSNLLVGVYHQNLRSGFIIRCSSRKEAQQHWSISWQDTINSWNERPALEHVSLSNLVNCLLLFLFSMTL